MDFRTLRTVVLSAFVFHALAQGPPPDGGGPPPDGGGPPPDGGGPPPDGGGPPPDGGGPPPDAGGLPPEGMALMMNFSVSGMSYLTSGECGNTNITTCESDGSSNMILRSLTYNETTGQFVGTIISNQCPAHRGDFLFANGTIGTNIALPAYRICNKQEFPSPAFASSFPLPAPLRGRIGLVVRTGVNLYNSFDAGFTMGSACTNKLGSCPAGTDVEMCENDLERQCGTANFIKTMFMSDCAGHAIPYHVHMGLGPCEYSAADFQNQHSPLLGIMLDGRGLYGQFEGNERPPTDLDACGGHFGPVPLTVLGENETYPAAENAYHYHVQNEPPFFIGCYGPVTSLTQAKNLYPSCRAGGSTCTTYTDCSAGEIYKTCTASGYYEYKLDCPIYHHMPSGEKFNQPIENASCVPCKGNCGVGGVSSSPSPSQVPPVPVMSFEIGLKPPATADKVLNTTAGSTLRMAIASVSNISSSLVVITSITYGPTGEITLVDADHPINQFGSGGANHGGRRLHNQKQSNHVSSSSSSRSLTIVADSTTITTQIYAPAGSSSYEVNSILSANTALFQTSSSSSNTAFTTFSSTISSTWATTLNTAPQPIVISNIAASSASGTLDSSSSPSLSTAAIVGIVIGSLAVLVLAIVVGTYVHKHMGISTHNTAVSSTTKNNTSSNDPISFTRNDAVESTFEIRNPSGKVRPVEP